MVAKGLRTFAIHVPAIVFSCLVPRQAAGSIGAKVKTNAFLPA